MIDLTVMVSAGSEHHSHRLEPAMQNPTDVLFTAALNLPYVSFASTIQGYGALSITTLKRRVRPSSTMT